MAVSKEDVIEFISNMTDYFYHQVYNQMHLIDAYGQKTEKKTGAESRT